MGNIFSSETSFESLRKAKVFPEKNNPAVSSLFSQYDTSKTGFLASRELTTFVRDLFADQSIGLDDKEVQTFLNLLGFDKETGLSIKHVVDNYWDIVFRRILAPKTAFVVVDVQNDFINGTLALRDCPAKEDGEEVVSVINGLRSVPFDVVALTADWHPADHCSFASNISMHPTEEGLKEANPFEVVTLSGPPKMKQVLWPDHCVQDSEGASFHKDLIQLPTDVIVKKGIRTHVDSYSGFRDNEPEDEKKSSVAQLLEGDLGRALLKHKVTDVYICGLATDVCVNATVGHSHRAGFRTILVKDASRGVNADNIEKTLQNMTSDGVLIVESNEVPDLVEAKHRPIDLAIDSLTNIENIKEYERILAASA